MAIKKLSNTEALAIKEALTGVWGQVFLECDGWFICATITRIKQRLVIQVFVDGEIDGKNSRMCEEDKLDELNEIQKKFMHHRKFGISKTYVDRCEKILGKKHCKENGLYKKTIVPMPYFNTPGAFVAKIRKACDCVVMLDRVEYEARLGAKLAVLSHDN